MDLRRYAAASFRQYRRSHLPVMLGVAVATAVLTGALLVGDSVRGSLRGLTLERLGRIDQAVVAQQPFRAALAEELAASPGFSGPFDGADAAFLLSGSLSSGGPKTKRLAGGVAVVGVTPGFGNHGDALWARGLETDAVALTQAVAEELAVGEGDEVVLRLPTLDGLPADSPLGEKTDTTVGKRLTVAKVLPPRGLARFALAPSQAPPRNAFVALATAQQLLDQPGRANAILVDRREAEQASPPAGEALLRSLLAPQLTDYGLTVDAVQPGLVQIESQQLVLPDAVAEATREAFGGGRQPVVTYLANTLRVGEKSVPYSTIAGVDSLPGVGPLLDAAGAPIVLADGEVAVNAWTAERLGAAVGDTVTVTYYEAESTHGELVEAAPLELTLRAIVPLAGPAADPRLTPVLEGVTDAESIGDWDLPFELVEPITQSDEDYWNDHSTTPKAFVSLTLAKRLWATRWGTESLVRVGGTGPDAKSTAEGVAAKLREALTPDNAGFAFLPVKRQGLAASGGTTPFDGLFFGFSLFLIASSVMLIALLFALGVENRARELGLLAAVGWPIRRVRSVLVRESIGVAAAGVAVGVPIGIVYAGLMITGLTTLWVDAIVAPFLGLHVTLKSLLAGAGVGLLVSWLTIRVVVRRVLKTPPRALLAGQASGGSAEVPGAAWLRGPAPPTVLTAGAVALAALGTTLNGESQAGAFFGSGALLLVGLLLVVRRLLLLENPSRPAPAPFRLWSLAWRNVARNPGRSLLTLGLVASASFLILAISAFRLDPTAEGAGGFVLVGESTQPVHYDLNTDAGRLELALSRRDEEQLDAFGVHALRVHDGEDASCLNLYQTRQPRILGLPQEFVALNRFAFAAGDWSELATERPMSKNGLGPSFHSSPFTLHSSPIPVVLDFNTAMYSLKLYGGVGSTLTIEDEAGREATLRVVGLLKNSLLQGDLLMREADFLRLYPSASGSRFFLIEPKPPVGGGAVDEAAAATRADELSGMFESRLSDYGMDVERTDLRLARFLAVQNTYLSTFQAVGGLGLLLGAIGVAVVQMRNLAERRGELALLRAEGFAPLRLRGLVFRENLLLLGGGLLLGAVAAGLALAPQTLAGATANAARLPWSTSGVLLAAILATGLAVGAWATRVALRPAIVPALRGE